jgi:hypothetical protein
VIKRPTNNKKKKKQNLCLDRRGYYSAAEIEREVVKRKYVPHICRRGEKKKKKHGKEKKAMGGRAYKFMA